MADSTSRAARLHDIKLSAGNAQEVSQAEGQLTDALNQLFIQCVLPNLVAQNLWGRQGRRNVEHVVADIMTSQIVRHEKISTPLYYSKAYM